MNKNLPNKWIRKAIFQAINNIVVDGKVVRCYDTNVSGVDVPNNYVILSTQSNIVEKANKCEYFWNSEILLDIVNIYQSAGNMGDRLLTDNITDEVRKLTDVLVLDSASNLSVISQIQSFPNGLNSTNDNQIIFRNFIRISLRIK
jgi:hypothetical protein